MAAALTPDSAYIRDELYGDYQGILDFTRGSFEKTLNIFGYFPFVSSVSGPIRICYGKVFLILSLAMTALYGIKIAYEANAERRVADNYKVFRAVTEVVHSLENIIRGTIETIPIVGNIAMVVYDLVFSRHVYKDEG